MKIVIFPYLPSVNPREPLGDVRLWGRMVVRLCSYLGPVPPGSKILTDRHVASRKISEIFMEAIPQAQSAASAWINPGAKPLKASLEALSHLFRTLLGSPTPLLVLVVPAALGPAYAGHLAELLEIDPLRAPDMPFNREACLIDPALNDPIRLISV